MNKTPFLLKITTLECSEYTFTSFINNVKFKDEIYEAMSIAANLVLERSGNHKLKFAIPCNKNNSKILDNVDMLVGARVKFYIWNEPNFVLKFHGRIKFYSKRSGEDEIGFECESLIGDIISREMFNKTFSQKCFANFGDSKCKAARDNYTFQLEKVESDATLPEKNSVLKPSLAGEQIPQTEHSLNEKINSEGANSAKNTSVIVVENNSNPRLSDSPSKSSYKSIDLDRFESLSSVDFFYLKPKYEIKAALVPLDCNIKALQKISSVTNQMHSDSQSYKPIDSDIIGSDVENPEGRKTISTLKSFLNQFVTNKSEEEIIKAFSDSEFLRQMINIFYLRYGHIKFFRSSTKDSSNKSSSNTLKVIQYSKIESLKLDWHLVRNVNSENLNSKFENVFGVLNIVLKLPIPHKFDSFCIVAGCSKSLNACVSYENFLNFRGYNFII